jgi:hypothetical protein
MGILVRSRRAKQASVLIPADGAWALDHIGRDNRNRKSTNTAQTRLIIKNSDIPDLGCSAQV